MNNKQLAAQCRIDLRDTLRRNLVKLKGQRQQLAAELVTLKTRKNKSRVAVLQETLSGVNRVLRVLSQQIATVESDIETHKARKAIE